MSVDHALIGRDNLSGQLARTFTETAMGHGGLLLLDEAEGDVDGAVERARALLGRWARCEDRHYTIPILRWAASLFAARGEEKDARACASALAQIVSEAGTPEAVAAL